MITALCVAVLNAASATQSEEVIFYGGDVINGDGDAISSAINTTVTDARCYDDVELVHGLTLGGAWSNVVFFSYYPKRAYYEIRRNVKEFDGGELLFSGTVFVEVFRTGRSALGDDWFEYQMRSQLSVTLPAGKYFFSLTPIGYGGGVSYATCTPGVDNPPAWDPNPPVTGAPIGNHNSFFDSRFFGHNFTDILNVFGGGDTDLSLGIGALTNTRAPSIAVPTVFAVTRGQHQEGVVDDLCGSENRRVVVQQRPPINASSPSAQIVTECAMPSAPVSALTASLEAQCTASPSSAIRQRVEFFDFEAGGYVTIDERTPTQTDSTIKVTATDRPFRFAEPLTNLVRTRLSWFDRGTLSPNWTAGVDWLWLEATP